MQVNVGQCEDEARRLNAPYLKLVTTGLPWVIAKWAMTLDGKLASRSGDSRWISGEASRRIVHQVRGRMDAIVVGRGTVECDDPLLTARPPGSRIATRVVMDRRASLASTTQLVRTARDAPVLVVVENAEEADRRRLQDSGCEVLMVESPAREEQFRELLKELGRRRMTNVLVEGGGTLLGALFDARLVDEIHVFVAPRSSAAPEPQRRWPEQVSTSCRWHTRCATSNGVRSMETCICEVAYSVTPFVRRRGRNRQKN